MIPYLLGIYRERQHSPGREFDDTEILRLVAKHIEAAGYQVYLKTPEELGEADHPSPSLVFLMCERIQALGLLEPLETKGIPHVNPLGAVLNTYRDRMIPLLTASGVPIPRSQVISSSSSGPGHPPPQLGLAPSRSGSSEPMSTIPNPEMSNWYRLRKHSGRLWRRFTTGASLMWSCNSTFREI